MELSVRVVETDGAVVELLVETAGGSITVITTIELEGEDLILRGLHIDGPGSNSAGLRTLRELARVLGRQHGVRRVMIFGGLRTTGANPGHLPRPVVILTGVS